MAGRSEKFASAAAALETFRRGSRGPRWEAAAEYLIRYASNDTRMLLDYAIERTRRELGVAPTKRREIPTAWIVGGVGAAVLLLGAFVWLFATILGDLECR